MHLFYERGARREERSGERRAVLAQNVIDSRDHTDRHSWRGEVRFDAPVRRGSARREKRDRSQRILRPDGQHRIPVGGRPNRSRARSFVPRGGDDEDTALRGHVGGNRRDRDITVQLRRRVAEAVVENEIRKAG